MMAPPGSPKTSVTPRSSSERTTASAPVITGVVAVRAGGRGMAAVSADMKGSSDSCRRDVGRQYSTGRRALRSGAHETGVLGKDATGIARRKRLPARAAGAQLGLIDE